MFGILTLVLVFSFRTWVSLGALVEFFIFRLTDIIHSALHCKIGRKCGSEWKRPMTRQSIPWTTADCR